MMIPRRLDQILTKKPVLRLSIIGDGLQRLGEHVAGLAASIETLQARDDIRGAAALDVICTEEAAKVLILLDMARDIYSQKVGQISAKSFYNHLARSIYAQVHGSNPADYREIVRQVKDHRESHYLDGPNDADWGFRNDLQRQRDTALYVDYEENEPGQFSWSGGNPELVNVSAMITPLVLSMREVGMLTEAGARATAEVWKISKFDESTRWEYCQLKALDVVRSVLPEHEEEARGLRGHTVTVTQKWTFPLTGLDLSLIVRPREVMQEKQAAHLNQMMMDEYGPSMTGDYR
ncbi:hypothetical protein CVV68_01595 [Arthrobacter livingstonensis]|uniref:Uncharacterized protein n=1 Tax=Arthrobacter livingstonensis TaxID=670078 RepID=A0A2V5LDQ7_9MICC|nr:AbiV family abortive infection protein [Arthrobacter livingstonensis]PYI69825.1 hypothetical protein CVV68_01595 [Arthrobacter livingstonensis]